MRAEKSWMGILLGIWEELQKLNALLAAMLPLAKELIKKMTAISDELDVLKQSVSTLTTVEQSAVALLDGLTSKIQAIIDAGGDPTKTLADIQAVVTSVDADKDELAAAVARNTPAAP